MDERDREIERLRRRVAGLEKTVQIVTRFSGRAERDMLDLFETISETVPVPLLISTESGEQLFHNRQALEIFGFSQADGSAEFKRRNAATVYENPEDRRRLLALLDARGEARGLSARMKKADGSVFPAALHSRRLIYQGRPCLLTVIHDLSELKREEQRRLNLERQIRQTQKMEAIGTLAGGIAHDFNNILAVIFGKLDLAMRSLPEKAPARRHLNDALSAAQRAKSMVGRLLDFCRLREMAPVAFPVAAIAREVGGMIRCLTSSRVRVNVRIEAPDALIMGDPTQIHQILMNLCANADYVLRQRGGAIDIILRTAHMPPADGNAVDPPPNLPPGDYARLTVADNGPGIDPDLLDRIFDPFFTTKGPGEGTGMGLSVVHGIVAGHGGAMTVESAPGQGAAFHCYFPLAATSEPADP